MRYKGTQDNYLKNRFKLDGNLYCKHSTVKKQLDIISQIRKENNETIFSVNYEQLLKLYEMENFSNDSEDYDVNHKQYETSTNYLTDPDPLVKDLRNFFPSRNTFMFPSGIKVSSDFDAGNLMSCQVVQEDRSYLSQKVLREIV